MRLFEIAVKHEYGCCVHKGQLVFICSIWRDNELLDTLIWEIRRDYYDAPDYGKWEGSFRSANF